MSELVAGGPILLLGMTKRVAWRGCSSYTCCRNSAIQLGQPSPRRQPMQVLCISYQRVWAKLRTPGCIGLHSGAQSSRTGLQPL